LPMNVKGLLGFRIASVDGLCGLIDDVLFDDNEWSIRYLTIPIAPAKSRRKVLLPYGQIRDIESADRTVRIYGYGRNLLYLPPIESDPPVSLQRRIAQDLKTPPFPYFLNGILGYFPFPFFASRTMSQLAVKEDEDDYSPKEFKYNPHLRSSKEVIGYSLGLTDCKWGRIRDIVFDAESGNIGNLIAQGRGVLNGIKLSLPVAIIKEIDWATQTVKAYVDKITALRIRLMA
jgi:hypothetical protein